MAPSKSQHPKSNRPWYDPGLSFSCTQCGNCCTGPSGVVYISDDEAKQLAEYKKVSVDSFLANYCEKWHGRWTLKEVKHSHRGFDCVFLRFSDRTGKAMCTVYPVRPIQCRTWPFWKLNLQSKESWQEAAKTCPGMRTGANFVPVEQVRLLVSKNPIGI